MNDTTTSDSAVSPNTAPRGDVVLPVRRYDTSDHGLLPGSDCAVLPRDTTDGYHEPMPPRDRLTSATRIEAAAPSSKAFARMGIRIVRTVPFGLFGLALIEPP